MKRRLRLLVGAALVGVGLVGLTTTQLFAQPPMPISHEQMHQMMDTMHGPGTSRRMHEAMAEAMGVSTEQVEQLMDQCLALMGTAQNMGSTMPGMMGGRNSQSMPGMMRGMMGW